jgi:hypothetical protein
MGRHMEALVTALDSYRELAVSAGGARARDVCQWREGIQSSLSSGSWSAIRYTSRMPVSGRAPALRALIMSRGQVYIRLDTCRYVTALVSLSTP